MCFSVPLGSQCDLVMHLRMPCCSCAPPNVLTLALHFLLHNCDALVMFFGLDIGSTPPPQLSGHVPVCLGSAGGLGLYLIVLLGRIVSLVAVPTALLSLRRGHSTLTPNPYYY